MKINHPIMELICAKYLMSNGYEVERQLNDILTCDVYAVRGSESLIVEVKRGFVPPEHALEPVAYNGARVASKVARYSRYADKFGLGAPPYYIMQTPVDVRQAARSKGGGRTPEDKEPL